MWSVISNNFTLLRNFINIINNRYGLIIGAKYHSSNMNDICMQSLHTTLSAAPQKLYGWLPSFWILSIFLYNFCVSHQPADLGLTRKEYLKYDVYNEYIRHMYIIIRYYYYWRIWKYYFGISLIYMTYIERTYLYDIY